LSLRVHSASISSSKFLEQEKIACRIHQRYLSFYTGVALGISSVNILRQFHVNSGDFTLWERLCYFIAKRRVLSGIRQRYGVESENYKRSLTLFRRAFQ
jgi:hypothetical protein